MHNPMSPYIATLAEPLVTYLAFVRTLASVAAFVGFEISQLAERLMAFFAALHEILLLVTLPTRDTSDPLAP